MKRFYIFTSVVGVSLSIFIAYIGAHFAILSFHTSKIRAALLWFIVELLGLIMLYSIRNFTTKYFTTLVGEQFDFEAYLYYYEYQLSKKFILYRKQKKALSSLAKGMVCFYQGDFQAVLDYIPEAVPKGLPLLTRIQYMQNHYFLRNATLIELGKLEEAPMPKSKKLQGYYTLLQGMKQVREQQIAEDIDLSKAPHRLGRILRTYYQALNEHNKGNVEQARELFETIASETADLFYVREAKRYLEKNNENY